MQFFAYKYRGCSPSAQVYSADRWAAVQSYPDLEAITGPFAAPSIRTARRMARERLTPAPDTTYLDQYVARVAELQRQAPHTQSLEYTGAGGTADACR